MTRFVAVAIVLYMAATYLVGQAPPPLAFEVASIKQEESTLPNGISGGACNGSDSGGRAGIPGMSVALGRCRYVGAKVKQLINNAYGGIALDRIVGGPGWIDSTPFSIDAKAEDASTPTRAQLMQMMRTLLEDRFKLKFHRETKEVSGYGLVIGKGGLKMKESPEGTRPGFSSGSGTITGSVPTSGLAGALTRVLGVPVTDGTGLTARYDITLKWAPDVGEPRTNAPDPTGPSIFTAVQELGLRLEPKKNSIELFVIDSIEKPSSN
jgi:uncharacterized protein (TIGR03435 family)